MLLAEATPVPPVPEPFQLHRIGGKVLLNMPAQVVGEYGHMIQSYKPTCGFALLPEPNTNSKVPAFATLNINHWGFSSPEKRHPEFGGFGFGVGLLILLNAGTEKSTIEPGPEFVKNVKEGLGNKGIAPTQLSLFCENNLEPIISAKKKICFITIRFLMADLEKQIFLLITYTNSLCLWCRKLYRLFLWKL